jgi:hypothetical protein
MFSFLRVATAVTLSLTGLELYKLHETTHLKTRFQVQKSKFLLTVKNQFEEFEDKREENLQDAVQECRTQYENQLLAARNDPWMDLRSLLYIVEQLSDIYMQNELMDEAWELWTNYVHDMEKLYDLRHSNCWQAKFEMSLKLQAMYLKLSSFEEFSSKLIEILQTIIRYDEDILASEASLPIDIKIRLTEQITISKIHLACQFVRIDSDQKEVEELINSIQKLRPLIEDDLLKHHFDVLKSLLELKQSREVIEKQLDGLLDLTSEYEDEEVSPENMHRILSRLVRLEKRFGKGDLLKAQSYVQKVVNVSYPEEEMELKQKMVEEWTELLWNAN